MYILYSSFVCMFHQVCKRIVYILIYTIYKHIYTILMLYIYTYICIQISQVEIPTGLPMLFDPRVKRIRLFEDEAETQSLFTKHNFGMYTLTAYMLYSY